MSEITRITAVAFLNKNEKQDAKSAKTPKNVVNDDYFNYACQYHALNIQCKVAESESIKVQYEKLDKLSDDKKKQLKIHKEHMDIAEAYINKCKELRDNFIIQIPDTLLSVFENDKFAKAYTHMLMNATSFTRAESTKNGVKVKNVPYEIFDPSFYTESITGANWRLSNSVTDLFDSTTPKAVKQEVFKPFISVLNEMFGTAELNKAVYKLPNFQQITNKLWSNYSQALKDGNDKITSGISFKLKADEKSLYTLALTALTHLHVVEIAENSDSKKSNELKTWAAEFAKSLNETKEKVEKSGKEEKATK